ncbi:hypothetical protein K491DRAFT_678400 [Lophiostoma macrostomum CBS 122681]|uniref:Uncharacterized protein n=1 Tax=Lophiostoma macrostomum CBS 122681 TaxID=1314788 RepID=A0A6A6TBR5_9PLEO|nr:hypothetical protein K491DRAFT_678400 [Lophiostoma macrostomum CBS 122681]
MASLDGSVTTVNGKVCTRRLRSTSTALTTAAASTSSTDSTSTTTTSEVQQVETSVAQAPPPASSSADPPPEAASTSTAQGTEDSIPSPAPPQGNGQNAGEQNFSVAAAAATSTAATSAELLSPSSSTSASTISSDPSDVADSSTTSVSSTSDTTSTGIDSLLASSTTAPQPQQTSPATAPSDQQPNDQPAQSTSTGVPSGGSAGAISPDQSIGGDESTLTLGSSNTNVGAIAGGVVGGVAGVALISVLLFMCLKRRKSREPFVKWQQRFSEKNGESSGLLAKLKAVPEKFEAVSEKLRAIPAGVGVFLGKLRGEKSGPAQNPYNRQSVRSSVSSVYSVRTNVRSRSVSEPPSKWRQQLRGFGDRMPSLKRSRTLLQQEQPVVEAKVEDDNPFADPDPVNPTSVPQIPAPALARSTSIRSQRAVVDGLKDQQRAPQSAAAVNRASKETFASLLDEIDERNGSGTPEWLKNTAHKRTQSASTALRSHPTSVAYTASVYTNADNPFFDPSDAPPVPKQPLPPNPPRRPSNAFVGFPTFNATSTLDSRVSTGSSFLLFGEPGPSRPSTNMFSEVSALPRVGRQSDPFDLDRPEVLRFGMSGQREVRASVTRQNSKSNRTSTVPNWVGTATPGPLRNPSVKR